MVNKNFMGFIRVFASIIILFILNSTSFADSGGDWSSMFSPSGIVPQLSSSNRTSIQEFEEVKIRGKNLILIGAQAGQDINLVLKHKQISSYQDLGNWELRNAEMDTLASGNFLLNESVTVSYTSQKTETLFLCVDTLRNGLIILSSQAPVGIGASSKAHLISNANKELYISVPAKLQEFSVEIFSSVSLENVKIEIYNPASQKVGEGETTSQNQDVLVNVQTGEYADCIWKIIIKTPTEGILEDYYIKLSGKIPPAMTLWNTDKFLFSPFGTTESVAVMVDKVLAATTLYDVQEWMVEEYHDAGFNVYVPRKYYGDSSSYTTDLAQLNETAEWCDARNMKTLVWMRGTLSAPFSDPSADGKRYLPGTGEISIWSPNSDELWSYLSNFILSYANLSTTQKGLQGVFLDFEDYSAEKYLAPSVNTYHISYDDVIIGQFEAANNITISVAPADRKQWLEENDLHDQFVSFQLEKWRQRCQSLRSAVDAINPQFQFYVYPFGRLTPFSIGIDAPVGRLSSPQAPVVLADSTCYDSDVSIIHDAPAAVLKATEKIDAGNNYAAMLNTPYMLLAGFDPICQVNDFQPLEYLARVPIVGAEKGNGYWVFYEFGSSEDAEGYHPYCMNCFSSVNDKIALQDWDASEYSYQEVFPWDSLWLNGVAPNVSCSDSTTSQTIPNCYLRGGAYLMLNCTKDVEVNISLKNRQLGSYTDLTAWEVRYSGSMKQSICKGLIQTDSTGNISFTPEHNGLYFLCTHSVKNAMEVESCNVPYAIYAANYFNLHQNTSPLYFYVPDDVATFTLNVKGTTNEHVKVSIYSPSGILVASDYTTDENKEKQISVNVSSSDAGVWKIVPESNGINILEDYYLKLSPGIAPCLTLSQDYAFFNKVDVEAETGTMTAPMQTAIDVSDPDCEYIFSGISNSGSALIEFTIPEDGEYYVWGRVWAVDGVHDSLYVLAEGDDPNDKNSYIWDVGTIYGEWQWKRVKTRTISPRTFVWNAGAHTLNILSRESFTRLDKLVITKDPNFIP